MYSVDIFLVLHIMCTNKQIYLLRNFLKKIDKNIFQEEYFSKKIIKRNNAFPINLFSAFKYLNVKRHKNLAIMFNLLLFHELLFF